MARNIIDSVLSEADRKEAKKVLEIRLEVGELMQLDRRALRFGLKLLMIGPVLEGAHVHIHLKKASFSCRRCGREWSMAEAKKQLAAVSDDLLVREPDSKELPLHFLPYLYPAFVHCPRCGSSDIAAKDGKEIRLTKLVVESGR